MDDVPTIDHNDDFRATGIPAAGIAFDQLPGTSAETDSVVREPRTSSRGSGKSNGKGG